jgi:hypothetical protein
LSFLKTFPIFDSPADSSELSVFRFNEVDGGTIVASPGAWLRESLEGVGEVVRANAPGYMRCPAGPDDLTNMVEVWVEPDWWATVWVVHTGSDPMMSDWHDSW